MNFLSELRRRNVYRVVSAYIIVGWLVMQVVDVMAPALLLPDWVARLVAVLLLAGFPLALVLAWLYDVTPEGIVKTDAPAPDGDTPSGGRGLDAALLAGLVAVAGLIVWQQVDRSGVASAAPDLAGTIAVLPFEDLSADGNQRYFADGVSEEILNALARHPELTVTGRTSSFSFRDGNRTLREIGAALGVAALLEGSVRKQDDNVRIAARLIGTGNGATIWSDTYAARLDDIFAVQDRIAGQVFEALTEQLGGGPATGTVGEPAFEVYDSYLRARELVVTRRLPALQEARQLLENVVARNPDYPAALAELALAERLLTRLPGGVGRLPPEEALPRAMAYAERALVLDPGLADGHAVRGLLYLDEQDLLRSEAALRTALDINRTHSNARVWLSLCLSGGLRFRDAAAELALLFEVDPLLRPASTNLVNSYLGIGDREAAAEVIRRLRRIEAPDNTILVAQGFFGEQTGDIAGAVRALRQAWDNERSLGIGAPLTFALLRIGDTEGALVYGLPFAASRSGLLNGNTDDAVTAARAVMDASGGYAAFQSEYLRSLADAGRDAELVAYFRDNFGDVDSFERTLFWPFTPELPPFWTVAYAMHRSGDRDGLAPVMARWRQAIDIGRANGAANYYYDYAEAQWYALEGETDTAVAYLERAAAHGDGLLDARTRYDYLNTLLAGHPGYERLMETNLQRINEERDALGLEALVF